MYIHHNILEIEQYANQEEWIEGTLIEEITEQEKMEKAMKDLENTLDLDSFRQVSFKLPQQTRVGTSSAGTSQQPVQETSTLVTGSSKGKEVADTEQQEMTDQQGKIPPVQTKAADIPALQTPINEERGKKRDREEATPISGPAEQPGEKMQRLNLLEEEIFEETTESLKGEKIASQQTSPVVETSTSSHRQ